MTHGGYDGLDSTADSTTGGAGQSAGREETRPPSQQKGPLEWNKNEHGSDKPKLGGFVTNRQEMRFKLKKNDIRWKVKSIRRKHNRNGEYWKTF